MATSPEYVRLATNSARTLADSALDSLRDGVLVIDARHKHFPVVLANAAARLCLTGEPAAPGLVESSLHDWLGLDSASSVESVLSALSDPLAPTSRRLVWRFAAGETSVATDIRSPAYSAGPQWVMLTFAVSVPESGLVTAIDNLPVGLLILNRDLRVTYANGGAERAGAALPGELAGLAATRLVPTAALHPDVFARALLGHSFHDEAVEISRLGAPTRWFEVDVQPLRSGSGISGVAVSFFEVTERRLRNHSQDAAERRLLALTEHARDIITVASADGTIQYVSGDRKSVV